MNYGNDKHLRIFNFVNKSITVYKTFSDILIANLRHYSTEFSCIRDLFGCCKNLTNY